MKNLSRLTALLLALVMLLGITASATEIDNFTKADYDELVAEQLTPVELPALTATDSGFNFAVAGEVPENAELYVTYMGADTTANIRTSILGLPELEEGMSEYAFDISIYENDTEWQPGTPVEVTITGIDTTEDSQVQVYHIPDPAQPAVATYSLRSTPAETAPVEFEEVEAIPGEGTVTFMADGFSIYYVVAGDTTVNANQDICNLDANSTTDTYYVMPGTKLTFEVNGQNSVTWSYNDLLTGMATSRTSGTSGSDFVVTVGDNASNGTFQFTASWTSVYGGYTFTTRKMVNVIVQSKEELVTTLVEEGSLVIACLQNPANGIPGEPGVNYSGFTFLGQTTDREGNVSYNTNGGFATSASGYISEDIARSNDLTYSDDGTNTLGLVDNTGAKTLAMTPGIDWDMAKETFASSRTIYDENGTRITTDNMDQYNLIPYVIKIQTTNFTSEPEWHIDCRFIKKEAVVLEYDMNLPDNMAIDADQSGTGYIGGSNRRFQVPNTEQGLSGFGATIGKIYDFNNSSTTISVGTKVRVTGIDGATYDFTFLGWTRNEEGSGEIILPNSNLTIDTNTKLYAKWESNVGTGSLKLVKLVDADEGVTIPVDEEYSFSVLIKNSEANASYAYTTYDVDDLETGASGTIASSGTITLKQGEYVIIKGIPKSSDGSSNVTIAEIVPEKGDYESSWINDTVDIAIQDGKTVMVTCTNTYIAKLTTLTITKSGMQSIDAGQSFLFKVEGEGLPSDGLLIAINGNGSETISGLKVGEKYTIEEIGDWSWRYSAEKVTTDELVADGSKNSVTISNTRDEIYWLDGDCYAENVFSGVQP